MSESLAKMRLAPFATEADVDEALRLFQVSTLDAAMSGNLSGCHLFYIMFLKYLNNMVFHTYCFLKSGLFRPVHRTKLYSVV